MDSSDPRFWIDIAQAALVFFGVMALIATALYQLVRRR